MAKAFITAGVFFSRQRTHTALTTGRKTDKQMTRKISYQSLSNTRIRMTASPLCNVSASYYHPVCSFSANHNPIPVVPYEV